MFSGRWQEQPADTTGWFGAQTELVGRFLEPLGLQQPLRRVASADGAETYQGLQVSACLPDN